MTHEPQPMRFRIRGMDCAEEVAVLKREIGPLVGGQENLSFDLLQARMTVSSEASVDSSTIIRQVARTGMQASLWERGEEVRSGFWRRHGRLTLTLISGGSILAAFLLHVLLAGGVRPAVGIESVSGVSEVPGPVRALYLLAILVGGWMILPKAWLALRRLRPDMNLLMTIAVAGAIAIGEWFEAATVTFLFSLSLVLEAWSIGRARRAVEALLDLAAPFARRRDAKGDYEEIQPSEVAVGSRLLIKPGEKVPLDGKIVGGSSHLNQAPITGESVPVSKSAGDEVFAGTINGDGALEIVTTREAEDTKLAHIIRLVGEAQRRRAPSEQWVEKFARYYTPSILGLAVAVLLVPPLVFGAGWEAWIYRALVLLVIGCPCALVISTPVSIVAALASAAHRGVLIKGGVHVETPARIRTVAFDKTGTLTTGALSVVRIVPLEDYKEDEVLETAASLESRSTHPLAAAIVRHAQEHKLTVQDPEDFQILPGQGAVGRLDGKQYWLGSHRYLEEKGLDTPEINRQLKELAGNGHTVVVVGCKEHVCGFLTLADRVRPEARQTVQELREMGISDLLLLTGDNRATADSIGHQLGMSAIHAELLPADKVSLIEKLVEDRGPVAMVGDGVNDAPAMARASVGIAMAAVGSDAALEASDIALMSDDLHRLPWLIRHSRKTLRIIHQNVAISIAIKVLFAVLTFTGFASLWAAIAADMGVSLLVIFNALRLLRS